MKKEEFELLAVRENVFELFMDIPDYEDAAKELANIVFEFVEKYKAIKKKYPNVGLGDTATDEAIVDVIYDLIHWGYLGE